MGELSGHREAAEPRPAPGPAERVVPGPGQESVWDYPRPPRVEAVPERLRVLVDGEVLADTTHGFRVLETAGAPVYYFPPADVRMDRLEASPHHSVCEWKGDASYYRYAAGDRTIENVAWFYPDPKPGYDALGGSGCRPRLGGLAMATQLAHASPTSLAATVSRAAVQSAHRPATDRWVTSTAKPRRRSSDSTSPAASSASISHVVWQEMQCMWP